MELERLAGSQCLIVASTGGHLAQAVRWSQRLGVSQDSTFFTFPAEQSRSLLAGRRAVFTGYVAPRDIGGVARAAIELARLRELRHADVVLSTGAGLALAALPASVRHRKPFVYIESVSRFLGPSLTGAIMARTKYVHCFTQHESWSGARWTYAGSLLSDYQPVDNPVPEKSQGRRIFVTAGTIAPYRFDRLVDSVLNVLEPEDQVVWQLGVTQRDNLPGAVFGSMPADQFEQNVTSADVVITHAGVGTLLHLMDVGVRPIVMARRASLNEHVDDHQLQVADYLGHRALVHVVEGDIPRTLLTSPGMVLRDK